MGRRHPSPPQASRVAHYGRKELPNQSPAVPSTPTPAPRRKLSPGLSPPSSSRSASPRYRLFGRRKRTSEPLIRRYQAAADALRQRQVDAVIHRSAMASTIEPAALRRTSSWRLLRHRGLATSDANSRGACSSYGPRMSRFAVAECSSSTSHLAATTSRIIRIGGAAGRPRHRGASR